MGKRKILLFLLGAIVLIGVAVWYYGFVYSKYHHRDAADEKAIVVTSAALANEYLTNEQNANTKYLDKTLEVSGIVSEIGKNQDGKVTVALSTNDIMTSVFCTLKDTAANINVDQQVAIKGICIGFTSDVKIKDAYLLNK